MYEWQKNELGEYEYVEASKKKPTPTALIAALVALITALLTVSVYSVFIVPNLRPKTVINHTESTYTPQTEGETEGFYGMGEKLSESVVAVWVQSSGGGFFSRMITSSASGVAVSEGGYILTTASAVSEGENIMVRTADGTLYDANLIGADPKTDSAVIKIDKDLPAVEFADSSNVKSGMSVAAVGRYLNEQLGTTLTIGTISGVSRGVALQNGETVNLFETTAATDKSAGSVLVTADGKVVGIVTDMLSAGADGIYFAIPSNDAVSTIESLVSLGKPPSGITIGIMGAESDYGIEVGSVNKGSAAEKAGLKKGDLIIKADGVAVKTGLELNKIRDSHQKGESMVLSVYRDGEMLEISVLLGE